MAGSFIFLTLCHVTNRLLDPPVICNKGVGLGIPLPVFFLVPFILTSLIIAFFFIWKILQNEALPPLLISFSGALLVGGAFSNIADRLIRGCIPDYFALGWFPAFNLADIGISFGALILLNVTLKK